MDRCVSRVIELFRALGRPGRRSAQGTWAEVLMILNAPDVEAAAAAWHADPEELHDFGRGPDRLEVKSTVGPIREHHFRLEQLYSPTGGTVLIASLLLTETFDGISLQGLLDRVVERLPRGSELSTRVQHIVAMALGIEWRSMVNLRFDEAAAQSSLLLFEAQMIPSVDARLPAGVREVRFMSDLSAVEPSSPSEACQLSAFYSRLLRTEEDDAD